MVLWQPRRSTVCEYKSNYFFLFSNKIEIALLIFVRYQKFFSVVFLCVWFFFLYFCLFVFMVIAYSFVRKSQMIKVCLPEGWFTDSIGSFAGKTSEWSRNWIDRYHPFKNCFSHAISEHASVRHFSSFWPFIVSKNFQMISAICF